jgi:hypothetical protein
MVAIQEGNTDEENTGYVVLLEKIHGWTGGEVSHSPPPPPLYSAEVLLDRYLNTT